MSPARRARSMPASEADSGPSPSAPAPAQTCPYLSSASRAWVASGPSADHRCEAVAPAAALALDKQRRLCLTADHEGCATYLAARAAREARDPEFAGAAPGWGWVRTTPIVDRSVGLGASVTALVAERRAWQVIPAVALVAALGALGLSNIGAHGPTATATHPSVAIASPTPTVTPGPTSTAPPSSVEPTLGPTDTPTPTAPATAPPTAQPTATPATATRTYRVKANDTLYGIARQFGVTVAAIKTLNGLTSNVIHAGLILKIP